MSKSSMMRFLAEKMWPWFKNYIWPLLREHTVELFAWVMAKLKDRFKEWAESRSKDRVDQAQNKVRESEKAARNAPSNAEREKHEAVAQVWREVAEQFRQDNEELRLKLDELTSEATKDFSQDLQDSTPDFDSSRSAPALLLGNKRLELPEPSSSSESDSR